MTFPVRYVADKRRVDTFARELSEHGVLLSCSQAPAAGTIIGMQLFLPSGIAPCAATGVVMAGPSAAGVLATGPGPSGGLATGPGAAGGFGADPAAPGVLAADAGPAGADAANRSSPGTRTFWAEFSGLTRSSEAVISALLHAGQRASRRAVVTFGVSCRIGERQFDGSTQNLGLGGVFVRASTQPEPDTIVEARLELPDGKAPAVVRGRVAHASPRGFGLQFLDGEEGFRPRIDALVAVLCARER